MTSRLISRVSCQLLNRKNFISPKLVAFNLIRKNEFQSSSNLFAAPIQLKMPALSPTMTEGQIIKWHKKEGDKIQPGDILFEVQTDKAVIPYELEEEGIIAKILATDSNTIKVGSIIGIMVLPGEDWKNVSVEVDKPSEVNQKLNAETEAKNTSHHHHSDGQKKIGPAARILLDSYQIDPNIVQGNPHGFISKSDVKEHIIKHNLSPVEHKKEAEISPPAPTSTTPTPPPIKSSKSLAADSENEPNYEDIELSNMRKVIAKRLVLSKTTIPHSYITTNCVVDKIVDLRKEMICNNQKVSLNDFIIKALGLALKMVPEVNSNQDPKTGEFKQLFTVDISVAVATDNGLITPIVKNADKLSVLKISETVKSLADKARKGKLMPHEFQGGSFSISNLGMFGISSFSAVINPPQIAILAVGKSQLKFNTDMKPQTEVSFTLSYDERCVDLNRAFTFMNTLNYLIANPELLVEKNELI